MEADMLANLDIDQIKTFLAIADSGSFTRAADDVNKTQSAVSMQMKRLEETLDATLFVKDGRAMRLSRDGERLVDQARKLASLNDLIVSGFKAPELSGTVRLGTPDDYADFFLPEVMGRFAKTHPQVIVDVVCLPSMRLQDMISHGELDMALVTFGRMVTGGDVIRREELVWVTSQRHAAHAQEIVPIAVADAGCAWRKLATDALETSGKPHRIAYTSGNRMAIDAAVLQGLAVATMTEMSVRPGMRILRSSDNFPALGTIDIGLIYKAGKLSRVTEALAQHIRDSIGNDHAMAQAAQ
jgi:DNA-binding transcriptional LysR family regulator